MSGNIHLATLTVLFPRSIDSVVRTISPFLVEIEHIHGLPDALNGFDSHLVESFVLNNIV